MKFFVCGLALAALSLAAVGAQEFSYSLGSPSPYGSPSSYGSQPSYAPAPSYSAPVYQAKPSYGPVKAGPAQSYSYPSPAPSHVPCATNLLLR